MCKKYKNMGASLRSACIEDQVFEIFPLSTAVYAEGLKYRSGTNKIKLQTEIYNSTLF